MRVGYLGPEGTFTEQAAELVGGELVGFATVYDVVAAVQRGTVDRGVVPIENSLEGGVNATLDALALEAREVEIVGETVLAIRNCLIARAAVAFDAIEVVVSHPQPLGQCARFLREELPGAELRATTSTADAVRAVAATDAPWAALGPRSAAALYDCRVLRDGIDDEPDNATRFVWLARSGTPPASSAGVDAWKTSVVFAGAGDRAPGWLVRCLSEFAFRGVNLTRIESRPRKGRLGHYLFHVDMDGRAEDPPVADAITALGGHCEEVRLLGSYPAA